MTFHRIPFLLLLLTICGSATAASDSCGGSSSADDPSNSSTALRLKLAALASILAAGAIGVCIPMLGRTIPLLRQDGAFFFLVKAFAAGIILATGFVHILPGAFDALSSPCLDGHGPWNGFPFAGFGAMVAAVGTLMIDCFATGYFKHSHSKVFREDDEGSSVTGGGVEVALGGGGGGGGGEDGSMHTHATHGHSHGPTGGLAEDVPAELARHRVVAQILELGIIVHSVVIGISLGASQNPSTIRPLVAALTFHQLFEGMGLGGCILQAELKAMQISVMAVFFSLTTPMGIAIGIGITSVYDGNSPTALVVQGLLESSAAGILIYMALVDLLAADFMNPKVQNNKKLQLGVNTFLLLGVGLMSFLATWV